MANSLLQRYKEDHIFLSATVRSWVGETPQGWPAEWPVPNQTAADAALHCLGVLYAAGLDLPQRAEPVHDADPDQPRSGIRLVYRTAADGRHRTVDCANDSGVVEGVCWSGGEVDAPLRIFTIPTDEHLRQAVRWPQSWVDLPL